MQWSYLAVILLSLATVVQRCWAAPHNEALAFSSNRLGNYEIYVMNTDGTNVKRRTTHPSDDIMPAWSPNGKRIAFCSDRDGDWELFSMNADGSKLMQLTKNEVSDRAPSWSPDGKSIAFHSYRDGNWELYIMKADGSDQRRVTNDIATQAYPVWSPDGKFLLSHYYDWQEADGNWELFRVGADGKAPTLLSPHPSADQLPSWSPDGKFIVFWSDREGSNKLFIQNADGSNQRKLTYDSPEPDSLSAAAWSPDSKKIVFTASHDLETMGIDGTGRSNLTNSAGIDIDPAWTKKAGSVALRVVPAISAAAVSGGRVNCPSNNAPTVAEVIATRTTLSFGRNVGRNNGVGSLPGFSSAFFDLIAPQRISLDSNRDGKYDGLDPIVLAAADLPSYCTLLVAEGINDLNGDPLIFRWQLPGTGTYYSTGAAGSSFARGEKVTDLSQYNRNSIIWEATGLLYPVLDHALMGGSTSVGFYAIDYPDGRNQPSCPALSQKASTVKYRGLNYGDVVHLELELLGKQVIPNTHPDPAYRGGIEVTFFAQIKGNYEAATFTTFRVDCGDNADTVFDESGSTTGGVLQCEYRQDEVGDMVTITAVGSSYGPDNGINPYANSVASIPFIMETFYSSGGTIGDTMTTLLEAEPGDLSVQLWDSGSLKDDAFALYIDGLYIGITPPGSSNLFFLDNLLSGEHNMEIRVRTAPDNIGTYTVRLFGGATFSGGGEIREGSPPEGAVVSYSFFVP